MDLATLIGLVGALAMVAAAIALGGDVAIFFDLPALLLVLGGTAFVVMGRFGAGPFGGALRVAGKAFLPPVEEPELLVGRLVALAEVARRAGFLALKAEKLPHRFLLDGVRLLAEGHEPGALRQTLTRDRTLSAERHARGQRIFEAMADVAPAMGLIGTLVGLVQVLANLADPASIGPALSLALLATLYGALLAHLVCAPIAEKLRLRAEEESLLQALVIDGLLAIQAGQSPKSVQDLLERYLPEGRRTAAAA